MTNDARRRGASFSSAFSIILSSAGERIAELGCNPVGDDPKAFVDRGGLSRLETEAAQAAVKGVREAAYPLIFKLFGAELPRGKQRDVILSQLGQDLARIALVVSLSAVFFAALIGVPSSGLIPLSFLLKKSHSKKRNQTPSQSPENCNPAVLETATWSDWWQSLDYCLC